MFGKNLRRLRKERKLTMKEFGSKFNLAESTISGYENGIRTPDIETIERFADFFSITVDELLGRFEYGIARDNTDQLRETPEWATARDKRDLKKFLEDKDVMFDGVPMTDEDKARIIGFMEGMFWEAKEMNKRKKKK